MNLDEALRVVLEAMHDPKGREVVGSAIAAELGDEAWDAFFERSRLEHMTRMPYRKLRQMAQRGDAKAKKALKDFLAQFPHLADAEPWNDPVSPIFQREIDAVPIKFERSA